MPQSEKENELATFPEFPYFKKTGNIDSHNISIPTT